MIMSLDDVIEELTKLLIKQDFEDKKNGEQREIKMKQVDLYKMQIKFTKLLKKYLQSK